MKKFSEKRNKVKKIKQMDYYELSNKIESLLNKGDNSLYLKHLIANLNKRNDAQTEGV